ncbi:SRPBCC family protein [bacterium]|nr:SRPBCC family protein [bacterium]
MSVVNVERIIEASVEDVFDVIAHIDNFSKAIPEIKNVEFVSETRKGVGTRFKETRVMKGREATVELEVAEYVVNDRVRILSEVQGTLWDSLFTVEKQEVGTKLKLVMEAKTKSIFARMMNAMIMGMIRKALANDMDAVKEYCEKNKNTAE